jgi:hypothetical protein
VRRIPVRAEFGVQVAALVAQHPPQLGRQGQPKGGREPLADLLGAELTPGSLGAALRTLGTLEQADAGMALLDEAVEILRPSAERLELTSAWLTQAAATHVSTGATALPDRPR